MKGRANLVEKGYLFFLYVCGKVKDLLSAIHHWATGQTFTPRLKDPIFNERISGLNPAQEDCSVLTKKKNQNFPSSRAL